MNSDSTDSTPMFANVFSAFLPIHRMLRSDVAYAGYMGPSSCHWELVICAKICTQADTSDFARWTLSIGLLNIFRYNPVKE